MRSICCVGAEHARTRALRAAEPDAQRLTRVGATRSPIRSARARSASCWRKARRCTSLRAATRIPQLVLRHEPPLVVEVDRERARFSTWYELFPRSAASTPGAHGTFADCEARLPYIAAMGFDVLYLPPIHPIGVTERKGPNNRPQRRGRRSRQPLGHRRRTRAATRRSSATWARSRTFSACVRKAERARHRDRARYRLSMLARSSLRARASGVVPASARTARSSTPRTRRKISGHLSVRLRDATTGARCGRS